MPNDLNLKVFIVEDDASYALEVEMLCNELGLSIIGIAKNYESALLTIIESKPDLVILDIELEGKKDGLQLAKDIEHLGLAMIIMTAFERLDYYEASKLIGNCFFGIKPLKKFTLLSIADQIKQDHLITPVTKDKNQQRSNSLFIRKGNQFKKVPSEEIVYVTADEGYCTIFTTEEKFVNKITLTELLSILNSRMFFRCHRSYIINTEHVEKFRPGNNTVKLGDIEIPISRDRKKELLSFFDIIS